MDFARQLSAPVPKVAPAPDYDHDPAEGVHVALLTVPVRYSSDPAGQGGGVPFAPTRPARLGFGVRIRPFGQWIAHYFHGNKVEIARRPSNTPGFATLAGQMQTAYQPAVTNPTGQRPWDTVRLGPTQEA